MEGMKIARSMALLSYRHYHTYSKHQSAEGFSMADDDRPASYQRYQGEKLAKRFNAFSYYLLTRSMDSHNLGDGKRTPMEALAMIRSKALVIGLQSDLLFPVEEQRFLARYIPRAELVEIDSITGHDGFLLEFEAIEKAVRGSHVPVS